MDVAVGELLVGRAWSWTPEVFKRDADRDRREKAAAGQTDPDYSVSVFATKRRTGETAEETINRLAATIRSSRNARWFAVTTQDKLRERGFQLELNEPPPDHYDLILGRDLDDSQCNKLELLFCEQERMRLPK